MTVGPMLGPRTIRWAVGVAVVCLNAVILIHFHDQFWWAPDEGNYAHVAERILDGEVMHRDVQDLHPGHINFVNAGAMAVFGRELVSMRYPLVALGILQCAIIFALLAPFGMIAAAAGATAFTALGFVQFLNPTAHWYVLFFVVLTAAVLHRVPRAAWWRLDAIGAILMTAVLFRQLSGVFVAMGAITVLLLEHSRSAPAEGRRSTAAPWIARAVVGIMLVGLVGYLTRATEQVGWLLFGIWPVALLLWTGWATALPNRDALIVIGRLARGGLLAALPLLVYHAVHGSFGEWYRDTIVVATQFPRMPFFDTMNYGSHAAGAVGSIISSGFSGVVNGTFWLALTVLGVVTGIIALRRTAIAKEVPPPLVILAVFYALVAVHYQIPIYLTYTSGLSLVALIMLSRGARPMTIGAIATAVIALYFHAGQPLSRGLIGMTDGVRTPVALANDVPRAGLRVEAHDNALYGEVISAIQREAPPGSTIFAVPSHAELYFLAERRNPFGFFNSAFGVRTPADLDAVLSTIERNPPAVVIYNRADKYNTAQSLAIMERVRAAYDSLPPIGQFELFRYRRPVAAEPRAESSRQ